MRPFWLALQFLTRLPTPNFKAVAGEQVGRSVLFYPLVGLLLGALLWGVAELASPLSTTLAAALLLTLWVLLSGALHLDGLADMADAWVGGHGDRERTLAIMKDPCSGPMGVSAVVLVLVLKFAALETLLQAAPWWLLSAPLLGRSAVLLLMLTTPYCREVGLASDMVRHLPRRWAWLILAVVAAGMACWLQWQVVWLLAAILLLFLLFRRGLMRRLQGFSGDTAGALIEIMEVVILLVGAGIITAA